MNRRENGFAVIFDMDGVIFDSERAFMECWKTIAYKYRKHDVLNVEELCHECSGMNREATKSWTLGRYGADFPYDRYEEEVYGNGKLPLKIGVIELLTFLEEHGILVALASSSDRKMVQKELDHAGITKYFGRIICGDMVKNSKPAPDIFLRASKELGIRPRDAYVIEDSYNGIRAAHAGGFLPVMVPDMAEPTKEMEELALVILPDLISVREYLMKEFPSVH